MSLTVKELIKELEKYDENLEVEDVDGVEEFTWEHNNYPYNLPDKQMIRLI